MDEIVIRLRPKHVERLIFIVVILLLLGVVFWQRGLTPFSTETKTTASAVAEEVKAADTVATKTEVATEEAVESLVKEDPEKIEDPVVEEPIVEAEEEIVAEEVIDNTPKATSGKRTFTITDIETTIKGEDWAKLNTFNLKIENGLSGINITYKVYIYNSGDTASDNPFETVILRQIEDGEIYDEVQKIAEKVHGESFNEIDEDKKLKVVFENSAGNTLETIVMNFKAS